MRRLNPHTENEKTRKIHSFIVIILYIMEEIL